MPAQIADILFDLGANEFLTPYLRRELGEDPENLPEPLPSPRACVRILQPGQRAEGGDLEAEAQRRGIPMVELRCAHIVGTGMVGLPRLIAERLYSGWYVNVRDCDPAVSLIHAVDVARAARLAAESAQSGFSSFTLTDGRDHTMRALAEALSFRLGDKRIFTVKPWIAKLALGSKLYAMVTEDQTIRGDSFAEAFPAFCPNDVCEYLRTHTYDDASL